MPGHIEVIKNGIEFNKPGYLPTEANYVPFIYNAYRAIDSAKVKFIPGTEGFNKYRNS